MESIEELNRQSGSKDSEERRLAAVALAECRNSRGREILLKLVADTDWRVRKAAVESVVASYDPSVLPGLIGILDDPVNAGARNSAIEALTQIGTLATLELMEAFREGDHDRRKFIIDILGVVGDKRCLPLMLDALSDPDENVQASAVEHLGLIGDSSVVEGLIRILESGEPWVAFPAAEALGKIRDSRAVDALIAALSKRALLEPALRALGRIGSARALNAVVPYVASLSKPVQSEALRALIGIHQACKECDMAQSMIRGLGENAYELLLVHAQGEDPSLKKPSVILLGLLQDARALRPLLELSADENIEDVVREALTGIAKAKPEEWLHLFGESIAYRRRVVSKIAGETGNRLFVPMLVGGLRDTDGHVRSNSARALGAMGETSAASEIARLLGDPYTDVQEAGVLALSQMPSAVSVSEAVSYLSHRNPVLRRNYAALLGLIRASGACEALAFSLKDDDVKVREAAVDALSLIGGETAYRALTPALTDEIPDIRRMVTLALGKSGREEAMDSILLVARDEDDWVRAAAAEALVNFQNRRSESALIAMLNDPCGLVRVTAIEGLGKIGGGTGSVSALAQCSLDEDPEIRRSVVSALASILQDEEAANRLIPLLSDPDWSVRKASVEALCRNRCDIATTALQIRLESEQDPTVAESIRECLDA